uniref:Uncharacterized protein n=1 Tax=Solanum tuberosum TaxID=4113 RepID=M1DCU4_SOLTU
MSIVLEEQGLATDIAEYGSGTDLRMIRMLRTCTYIPRRCSVEYVSVLEREYGSGTDLRMIRMLRTCTYIPRRCSVEYVSVLERLGTDLRIIRLPRTYTYIPRRCRIEYVTVLERLRVFFDLGFFRMINVTPKIP